MANLRLFGVEFRTEEQGMMNQEILKFLLHSKFLVLLFIIQKIKIIILAIKDRLAQLLLLVFNSSFKKVAV